MRAVVHTSYGPPEVLHLDDVDKPTPRDNEVLVKVHATTVNRTDCGIREAEPVIARLSSGLLRPKHHILGSELAGEVEAVGEAVTEFHPGDQVFGVHAGRYGAHAEYVCMPERAPLARKPANLSFEEAAAVCDGAILALTYLRAAAVGKGTRLVVYGASGSIGTAGVQLAKRHFEADVTAVCNTDNVEVVGSLGADRVIDYTREDFTTLGETYDVVFDAVGKLTFGQCKPALRPGGIYTVTDLGPRAQNPLLALWTWKIGSKRVLFPLPRYTKADVLFLKKLVEEGTYRPVIDRRYPLEGVVEATRYVETGQKVGNVVLIVRRGDEGPSAPAE